MDQETITVKVKKKTVNMRTTMQAAISCQEDIQTKDSRQRRSSYGESSGLSPYPPSNPNVLPFSIVSSRYSRYYRYLMYSKNLMHSLSLYHLFSTPGASGAPVTSDTLGSPGTLYALCVSFLHIIYNRLLQVLNFLYLLL